MTACANSHDRDETCPDCDPSRLPARDRPGPPLRRDRALERVHELQERLAQVDGFPPVPLTPDDDVPATPDLDEETRP